MQRLGKTRSAIRKFPERDRGITSFFFLFFLHFFFYIWSDLWKTSVNASCNLLCCSNHEPLQYHTSVSRIRTTNVQDISLGENCPGPILIILFTVRENFYTSSQFAPKSSAITSTRISCSFGNFVAIVVSMMMEETSEVQRACNIARPSNRNFSHDS